MDTVTEDPTTPADESAALYRWSAWTHVGPGAEQCDQRESACANPAHFHAWCRLPNSFQHREIREVALAARARLVRRLRDEDSDAGSILREDIEQLHQLAGRSEESANDVQTHIIGELVEREWYRDYADAMAELADFTDDKDEKPYEFVERDQERYQELARMPEAERPAEEFTSLQDHLSGYGERIQQAVEASQRPRREALAALDFNDLIDLVRDDRIKQGADEEFDHAYAAHSWLLCTARSERGERWFPTVEALQGAAPEVIAALKETYEDLERSRRRGASGKS